MSSLHTRNIKSFSFYFQITTLSYINQRLMSSTIFAERNMIGLMQFMIMDGILLLLLKQVEYQPILQINFLAFNQINRFTFKTMLKGRYQGHCSFTAWHQKMFNKTIETYNFISSIQHIIPDIIFHQSKSLLKLSVFSDTNQFSVLLIN